MPQTMDDYVHRIGRTGRAGKSGIAITLFNTKDFRNLTKAKELYELISQQKSGKLESAEFNTTYEWLKTAAAKAKDLAARKYQRY